MKLLAEISEGSLGLSNEFEQYGENYELRKSARAILLNEEGKMATQHLQTYSFYKLPGGGVESGETVEEAFRREVLEEVGCNCEIVNPVGLIIEYRNKYKMIHLSYCFSARVMGEVGEPQLEPEEVEEGQITLWLPPEEVLTKIQSGTPKKFEGYFIIKREAAFLEEYLKTKGV